MKYLPRRLTHMMLILLCNLSAFMLLSSFFELEMVTAMIPVLLITSVLAVVLCESEKYRLVMTLSYAGIILLLTILFGGRIREGFEWIKDSVVEKFCDYYGWDAPFAGYADEDTLLLVFIVYIAALSLLLGIAFATNRFYFLWIIPTSLPIVAGTIFSGFPEALTMLAYALTVFGLIIIQQLERNSGNGMVGPELALVCGVFLVFLLFPLIFSEDSFERNLESETRGKVQELHGQIESWVIEHIVDPYGLTGRGDQGMGIVSRTGPNYTGKTDLVVTLPKNSPTTYLRGYVGQKYENGMWNVDDHLEDNMKLYDLDEFTKYNSTQYSYNLLSPLFESDRYRVLFETRFPLRMAYIGIESKLNLKYVYSPYCATPYNANLAGTEYTWNAGYMSLKKYSFSYIYNTGGKPNAYAISEGDTLSRSDFANPDGYLLELFSYSKAYKDFAKDCYSEVPKEYRDVLENIVPKSGTLTEKVNFVQNYMRKNFHYTLNPPRAGKKEDPVMTFLTKTKKGFCQYYATVAVMMFRMMGVPARYAEGYVIQKDLMDQGEECYPSDFSDLQSIWNDDGVYISHGEYIRVNVPDSNAHAWPEIWIEGYGWYPVEVTTGFGGDVTWVNPKREPTPTPTKIAPRDTVSVTPRSVTPKSGNTPSSVTPTKLTPTPVPTKEDEKATQKKGWWFLLIPLGALLMAEALYLHYRRKCNARIAAIGSDNRKEAVLALYKEIVRLYDVMEFRRKPAESDASFHERLIAAYPMQKGEISMDEVVGLTKKAVFSQNVISEDEFKAVTGYYRSLRKECLDGLGRWKRFRLVFFKGI